jgi:molecular chaperone DnaK
MSDFKPVVGIDLGTTFSAIAYIDEHKKPIVIPNQENRPITPSVVNFIDKDTFVVGDEAVNSMIADKDNTVSFIKREMGNPNYKVTIHGREYTPQEISARILAKLKKDAESYFKNNGLDIEVKDAVITVPAYFGMEQKGATKQAGEIAGLNVLHILNEPTAAALAFGLNNLGKDKTVFVFDLGGGTFDVTILQIKGTAIDMVASDGNARLGGKDWDDLLVSHCSQIFKDSHGMDPQDDPHSSQELYERVLKAKISMSLKPKVMVPVSHDGKNINVELTREKFEELSKDLVYQCKSLSEHVLEKAGKTWKDIDTILLVGGATYMPMIRNLVKEISAKEPSTDVNPDQCVAIGAAWKAFLDQTDQIVEEIREEKGDKEAEKVQKKILGHLPPIEVTESVAKSLGVIALNEAGKEAVFKMIPEQTKIPPEGYIIEDDSFSYAEDNQTSLCVRVTEGEGTSPDEVNIIGQIVLDSLPPRRRGSPIKLIYNYNKNKILEIEVIDVETGKSKQGKVVFEGSMSEAEKQDAIKHQEKQKQG